MAIPKFIHIEGHNIIRTKRILHVYKGTWSGKTPTIYFIFKNNAGTEWLFDNKEERDMIYDKLKKILESQDVSNITSL